MDPNNEASTSGADQTVLAFPPPPLQYINLYTSENIENGTAPEPPPPITDGVYYMFGQKISLSDAIVAPLESHGTKRLYPRGEYDHKKELKKINASILVNFLDLVDVLVRCPDTDKRIEKCNDLATLFINFHHLINELRPHQARETLRVWLTYQKKSRLDINQRLIKEMDRASNLLNSITGGKDFDTVLQKLINNHRYTSGINNDNKEDKNAIQKSVISEEKRNIDEIMCALVDDSLNIP